MIVLFQTYCRVRIFAFMEILRSDHREYLDLLSHELLEVMYFGSDSQFLSAFFASVKSITTAFMAHTSGDSACSMPVAFTS